ncbi:MAG: right-handed parallel beta-helix repeat-containing protein [Candidatus Electryonea clarkiae]|nr:right-handed parallel beta-helix repeat-containing protein [Candidatus Electryonea clarkiae]MDP8289236.1 right-handed parallel beta-helix repeat-containing protein [Candidatus Electryonea clarkiae]
MRRKLIVTTTFLFLTVLFFSNSIAGEQSGTYWYSLKGAQPKAPEWTMISQCDTLMVLEVDVYGFFYEIIDGEMRINLPNCSAALVEEGYPETPETRCAIGVPECDEVTMSIEHIDVETVYDFEILYPRPEIDEDGNETYKKISGVYSSNEFYPEEDYYVSQVVKARNQHVVKLYVNPVRYNPGTNTYKLSDNIRIEIRPNNPVTGTNYPNCYPFNNAFQAGLVGYEMPLANFPNNPEVYQPARWPDDDFEYVDLLIITSDDPSLGLFDGNGDPSDALYDYCAYRAQTNHIDIVVRTIETNIQPNDPDDEVEFREYLRSLYTNLAYQSRHYRYPRMGHVLFIGDKSIIPHSDNWLEDVFREDGCDVYYAKLDIGANPDDETFCYDLPDVIIGRFPVANIMDGEEIIHTANEEFELITNKIMMTEGADFEDERPVWARRLFISNPGNNDANPRNSLGIYQMFSIHPFISEIIYLHNLEAGNVQENLEQIWDGYLDITTYETDNDGVAEIFNESILGGLYEDPADHEAGTLEPTPFVFNASTNSRPETAFPDGFRNYDIDDICLDENTTAYFPVLATTSCRGADINSATQHTNQYYVKLLFPQDGVNNFIEAGPAAIIGMSDQSHSIWLKTLLPSFYRGQLTRMDELLYVEYLASGVVVVGARPLQTVHLLGDPLFDPVRGEDAAYQDIDLIALDVINTEFTINMDELWITIANRGGITDCEEDFTITATLVDYGTNTVHDWGSLEYTQTLGWWTEVGVNIDVTPPTEEEYPDADFSTGTNIILIEVDSDDDVEESSELNNVIERTMQLPRGLTGFPQAVPITNHRTQCTVTDIDIGENNGLELVSSNFAFNLDSKSYTWENVNPISTSVPVSANVDQDASNTGEIVYMSSIQADAELIMLDSETGTEDEDFTRQFSNTTHAHVIPIDAIADNPGLEFLVRKLDNNTDEWSIGLYVYDYDSEEWDANPEWEVTSDEFAPISLPTIAYPLPNQRPQVCFTIIDLETADNHELHIHDLETGTITSDPDFLDLDGSIDSYDDNAHYYEGRYGPVAGDIDDDGDDELYFTTTKNLFTYDYPDVTKLTTGTDVAEMDMIATPAIGKAFGFDGSSNPEWGVSYPWGTSEYEVTQGNPVDFRSDMFQVYNAEDQVTPITYLDSQDDEYLSNSHALIGTFESQNISSVLMTRRCAKPMIEEEMGEPFEVFEEIPEDVDELLVYTAKQAGGFDLEVYPLADRVYSRATNQTPCSSEEMAYDRRSSWLVDMDDDGYLDYVYLTASDKVGVIETEVQGSAEWSHPLGNDMGTCRNTALKVTGTIPDQAYWTGHVKLTGTPVVPAGDTLTIAPGTTIECAEDSKLTIQGTLIAKGASGAKIIFKAEGGTAGDWVGIIFNSGSEGDLEWINICDGIDNIMVNSGADVDLTNFTLDNASNRGLYANGAGGFEITYGEISECATFGIETYNAVGSFEYMNVHDCGTGLKAVQSALILENSSFNDNDDSGVDLTNCQGATIEYCTLRENGEYGLFLSNSDPFIKRSIFRENYYSGIKASNSSDCVLGVQYTKAGNTFFENGDYGLASYTDRAEICVAGSYPVLDIRHNDFIDEDTTYLFYDLSYSPPPHAAISNYWEGDPDNKKTIADWFYPYGSVAYDPSDDPANNPDDLDDGDEDEEPEGLDLALIYEFDGEYEDAADEYMTLIREDNLAAALDGWIRCQLALEMTEDSLITILEGRYINHRTLGNAAYWARIRLQNRQLDFDSSIDQLDDRIMDVNNDVDSLLGLLGQLDTYYEMYLSGVDEEYRGRRMRAPGGNGIGDKLNRKGIIKGSSKTRTISKTAKKDKKPTQPVGNDGSLDSNPGQGEKKSFELTKLGLFDYPVPLSLTDYHKKRKSLMAQLNAAGTNPMERNPLPEEFDLQAAYPNPFNPTVNIPFAVPKLADVTITVYNILGQNVITLVDGKTRAGYHRVLWKGESNQGLPVASGIYFVKMEAPDFVKTNKIVLLK